jgi:shikimate kinase
MSQVVLVGLMGSGKSTVGALVAEHTGRAFVDVDVVIARETGKTVRQLWEEGGESAYRHLESDVVLRALRDDTPSVLAAPAGVILDSVVRAALAGSIVVWLHARPSTLAGRVRPGDHRPLLGERPAETLTAMADARDALYRQVSTAIVETDDRTPEAVAAMVVELVARVATRPAPWTP